MTHDAILIKKFERLSKFTGSKLRKKTAAYNAALARYKKTKAPVLKVSESQRPVENSDPEFNVFVPDSSSGLDLIRIFKVKASNEKAAREEARKVLKVTRLPVGTKFAKANV